MNGKGTEILTQNGMIDVSVWEDGSFRIEISDEEGWGTSTARLDKEGIKELMEFLNEEVK